MDSFLGFISIPPYLVVIKIPIKLNSSFNVSQNSLSKLITKFNNANIFLPSKWSYSQSMKLL